MGILKKIGSNPTLAGLAEILPDIVFSRAGGEKLTMQLITPWWDREGGEIPSYPAVVFVQGSGWTFPNVWYEVPQLCELARKGYVVATITHRNSMEGHPFPACLEDVKTAIRYLRKNAHTYGIDANRIGLWGTSSGGNLSLLAAMTAGDKRYETEEYAGYDDGVNFCIACFPTTDFVECYEDESFDEGLKDVFRALSGGCIDNDRTVLKELSPCYVAGENASYPPIFLAHGDADMLIPYEQSLKLYRLLEKMGADVSMVTVENAPHEGSFWSRELLELIFIFIEENSD